MLDAIYAIGQYIINKESLSKSDILLDGYKLKNTKKVLCIYFNKKYTNFEYGGVIEENFDSNKISKYLYKRGSSRGTDIVPSTIIADIKEDPKKGTIIKIKAFDNKIINWFKEILLREGEDSYFRNLSNEILSKKEIIEKDIIEKYSNLGIDTRRNVLLTLKFKENGKEYYLGEEDRFKQILFDQSIKRYSYLKSLGECVGYGNCILCNKSKNVSGFVLPAFGFSFSTADKIGFTQGFNQIEHWKSTPICEDCALQLEAGKKFLDNYLNFNFMGGFKYYVVPKITLSENMEIIMDEIYDKVKFFENKEYSEGLVSEEDYLTEILASKNDILRLVFIFYVLKGGGSYIDIVSYVDDVLPSRMKKIDDTQRKLQKVKPFDEDSLKILFGNNWIGTFVKGILISSDEKIGKSNNWYLKFLRDFFPNSKIEGIYDKYFLEIISSILSGKYVSKDLIFNSFLRKIRYDFINKNDYEFKKTVIKSLMLYDFLYNLNLFRGVEMKETKLDNERVNLENSIEEFFESRKNTFSNDQEKASFIVGALVNYVLFVQRKDRELKFGEEPFRKKLMGLKLDEKKIKSIFSESIEKLTQYGSNYPSLERNVADYLTKSGRDWTIYNDEISYFFSLGLTLGVLFKKDKEVD